MNKFIYNIFPCLMAVVLSLIFSSCERLGLISTIESNWKETPDRYWVGPDYWANTLQDWRIHNGRLECVNGQKPLRTVHLLSGTLQSNEGNLRMSVKLGPLTDSAKDEDSWAGFLIGAGSLEDDYRLRALIHQAHGNNGGLIAAINGKGRIIFLDNENQRKDMSVIRPSRFPRKDYGGGVINLQLEAETRQEGYHVVMEAFDEISGRKIDSAAIRSIPSGRLSGNIALAANMAANKKVKSFWFNSWEVKGSKLSINEQNRLGPVIGAQYTISEGTLNLTAHLAPVSKEHLNPVTLEVAPRGSDEWKEADKAEILTPGWTAPFRIKDWDNHRAYDYRISYPLKEQSDTYYFEGTIRKEPVEKADFTVAAFTGNSNTHGSFGNNFDFSSSHIWFPHNDIVNRVSKHNPDFLAYTGDQVYEGRPTRPDKSGEFSSFLDYLYKWYLFLWAHGELTRNIPSVTIPDDHDVYQGNLWGAGGKEAEPLPDDEQYPAHYRDGFENHYRQDRGGYVMPPEFVNMVQRTQTSHLPEPYDPALVKQGIEVYYTDITYGRMSFAVLEDRKFKSSPSVELPQARVVNGFSRIQDISKEELSTPEATLYGNRQLKFLRDWSGKWKNVDMKATFSQTILACLSTYPDSFQTDAGTPKLDPLPRGEIPQDYEKAKDMDSNGWPPSGRDRALKKIRKGYALMIAGDQHLASMVHHGIDEWGDAGYSLCVPSIANLWPRRWFPPDTGRKHQTGLPPYTGRYYDGFGNLMTVWAVANPYKSGEEPEILHNRAPGYGIIRFHKDKQQITMECWPRYANPVKDPPYPGWPKTIDMEENYGRKAQFRLPSILTKGLNKSPVYKVLMEPENRLVYARRAKDSIFQPGVFEKGSYTLMVGVPELNKMDTLENIQPIKTKKQIILDFRER
ncbi:MAG: alkaline phosphatase D family protein [Bacteroidales bacterium]|nr:alkaline phosphatase D family protein [Bacteroidales bacterium]